MKFSINTVFYCLMNKLRHYLCPDFESGWVVVVLSVILMGCQNKKENWLRDYAQTKFAYQQVQQTMNDDSVKQIASTVLEKEKCLHELALLSEQFNKAIEFLNQEIKQEQDKFVQAYRKTTDRHNEKYGHVSTPGYEKAIENLQKSRDSKILSLQENIRKLNAELSSNPEVQKKSLQIQILTKKIDAKKNTIRTHFKSKLDSLQEKLNSLNRNFQNMLNQLPPEDKSSFKRSRDSIRQINTLAL